MPVVSLYHFASPRLHCVGFGIKYPAIHFITKATVGGPSTDIRTFGLFLASHFPIRAIALATLHLGVLFLAHNLLFSLLRLSSRYPMRLSTGFRRQIYSHGAYFH